MLVQTHQRLSIERLKQWQALQYGMFLHFSINTYDGEELSLGQLPAKEFNPRKLDVDQWVSTIKEAGMRYAVLTTKHVAGFCLWPSNLTDYHIGNSPSEVDIVGQFVESCHRHDIRPGLYYCSWDNHHTFGMPSINERYWGKVDKPFHHQPVSREYEDYQKAQLGELLTCYPDIEELWIDIPAIHSSGFRMALYDYCASIQPNCVIIMNNGIHDKQALVFSDTWPTDVMTIERTLPLAYHWNSETCMGGWDPYVEYVGEHYYIPAEVCDTIGYDWFYVEEDPIRSEWEIAGMVNIAIERNANMLLNVGPTQDGLIHPKHVEALLKVREHLAHLK